MADMKTPFVAGFYDDPKDLLTAATAATERGFKQHDAVTPYPVHGLEHCLGLKRSWIGRPVLAILLLGALAGFMMQYWMMKVDWPINIAGKPFNSWPAFVVITFECGILAGALANMFIVLFAGCRLNPDFATKPIREALTDDLFCLAIPLEGNGSEDELRGFLSEQGAADVQLFDQTPADDDPTNEKGGDHGDS